MATFRSKRMKSAAIWGMSVTMASGTIAVAGRPTATGGASVDARRGADRRGGAPRGVAHRAGARAAPGVVARAARAVVRRLWPGLLPRPVTGQAPEKVEAAM